MIAATIAVQPTRAVLTARTCVKSVRVRIRELHRQNWTRD
jgi:hypothetical protein